MIGAGSWLLPACLEKLQEISGAAAFFVETQIAAKQYIIMSFWLKVMFTMKDICVDDQFYLLEQVVKKTQLQWQD